MDLRNGLADVFLNSSTNGGVTWQSTDVRLDGGDAPGAADSDLPEICCDGAHVYVVWDDGRNTERDIFFNGATP